jgi:hypothetical protein
MTEKVLVRNAADPEQVKSAKQKEMRGRDLELADLAWVLSERQGRRFLWKLLEFCGIGKLSFSGELVATTNFNEGMKNVANKVLADIMECRPESYIEMITENKKENENGG